MSGHERERLSAYLDGELPPGERAEVSAHLATCPACAAFLADLAAVDAEAAGMSAEAPEGYFEHFASRVVARLAATPKARVRSWRPPAWTWAAAAALLLAVVTPLTLRERPVPVAPAPAAEAPAVPRDVPERDAGEGRGALAAAPPPMPEKRAARPDRAPVGEEEMSKGEALPVPAEAAGPAPVAGLAPADAPRATASREEVFADASAASETAGGPPPSARTTALPAAASLESAAPAPGLARGPMGKAAAVDEAGRAFRRLDAVRPASAEEWRRLREEWLAFVIAHGGDRRADEARVRAIEAAREAWLASGDEADEQAFRRDAAAYLVAADALQKARVERLVADPRP